MNKMFIAVTLSLCAALALAEGSAPARKVRRHRRPSAGVLERPLAATARLVGVYDLQKAVDAGTVAAAVRGARWASNLPLAVNAKDAPVRIELVESDAFGRMVVYPEDFKAQVNVKALAADAPSAEVLATRLKTELARAALFVLGSGSVSYKCLTMPVRSLAELDKLEKATPGAETFSHLGAARALGVAPLQYTSYEVACQEGWAPAPTNDIQKAVWDKVHQMPTAPLKIKPETKKVAE